MNSWNSPNIFLCRAPPIHGLMPCRCSANFYKKNTLNFLERHLQATPGCPVDNCLVPLREKTSMGHVQASTGHLAMACRCLVDSRQIFTKHWGELPGRRPCIFTCFMTTTEMPGQFFTVTADGWLPVTSPEGAGGSVTGALYKTTECFT